MIFPQKQSRNVVNKDVFSSQIELKPSEINLLWGICQEKFTRRVTPFIGSQ